jgi:membrane associated rhomboid family serine protease
LSGSIGAGREALKPFDGAALPERPASRALLLATPVELPLSAIAYGERMVSTTEVREDGRFRGLILVAAMVAVMWAVEIVDVVAGDLDSAGIRPRDPEGLIGIPLAPVLHGGFGHLIGNTIPFLVLGGVIALSGLARVVSVTLIVALVGGLGTWLVAPANTVHIGASGLVFGFAAYLIARGVFSRRALHLVAGVAVLFIYGGTLAFGLVPTPGISWQGHLFGAVGGLVAAWGLDRAAPPLTR